MATFKNIPIDDTPARSITTTINGQVVKVRTYYNITDSGWFFDLYDVDDNPILLGRALVTGMELLYPHPDIDLDQLAYISLENEAGEGKSDPGNTTRLVSRIE